MTFAIPHHFFPFAMAVLKLPAPPAPPFSMSVHADLRTLERFGLSGGHVLAYLDSRLSVWLDEVNPDGTRYALLFSAAAATFIVAAVAPGSVLKTVLTQEMYERSRSPLGAGQLALARYSAAQALAREDEPVAPASVPTLVPAEVDPVGEEVKARRMLERDGGLSVSDMLELWTRQAPSGYWLRIGVSYDRCMKDRHLGHLSQVGLTALGQELPQREKGSSDLLAAVWVQQLAPLANKALSHCEVQAWLLRRLQENLDVIDSLDCFYVDLGHGWHARPPLMRLDVTPQVRCALGLGPTAASRPEAANVEPVDIEVELAAA